MAGASSIVEGGPIVDVAWIVEHMRDPAVRLVEVDVSKAAYESGHIPGAVLWNAYSDLRDSDYLPIGHGELEQLLSRSGIAPGTTVVVYGYGAALGFWLMTAYGHGDVRMLIGSREQWSQAGQRWSTDVPGPDAGTARLAAVHADALACRADVEAAIGERDHVLLDVRSEAEYDGERFWPSGATEDVGRAGRLPGATSVPIDALRNEDDTLKPVEELRRVCEEAGITGDKHVIVYCTIGNRASQAWFALKYLLGYPDVRVYYASWVEWGKATDTPIES
jgi:thiosulfate/3-mercaptopyruvate sulfurtransferase